MTATQHGDDDENAVAGRRALVVTAHPDDAEFGAAGTIARWVDEGWTVTYCVCTYGDAGGFDPSVPRAEIGGIRRFEQIAAARELGVEDVRFLGYPDGGLEPTPELVRDIVRVIRDVRPGRAIIQSPERDWKYIARSHPDHLAAGEASIRAIYPFARNPFAFPELLAEEGLDAWTVPETWVMGGPEPDRFVDVTDYFERKLAALDRHESQIVDRTQLVNRLRLFHGAAANAGGFGPGRLAERFNVYSTA